MSQLLVLLAPLWLNAFVYMVFARLIYFLLPSHRLHGIHASKVAFIFVWLDFLSFIIQLIGSFAASPGAPPDQIQSGLHIYMGGIGIQEFWILIVLALAVSLWLEIRKVERSASGLRFEQQRGWRKVLITVYAVLVLITVRVIFRLAEFSGGVGTSNPLPHEEAYFYCLDAVPMALATGLLTAVHPGTLFRGPYSEFPSLTRKEKKEVKRVRKEAQQAAKDRGEGKFLRWRLGREIKRQETERIAAEKWGVKDFPEEKSDQWRSGIGF
jgi:RTA1 like protein